MTDQHNLSSPKLYYDKIGSINSVYPPTTYLTNGPWIYLVPQFKPKSVLILGYAGGTVAGLIRLLYGDLPITAVDCEPCNTDYGVDFIQTDARTYVKVAPKFDVVVVDLFPNDRGGMDEFVTSREFATDLSKIGNYIIVNTTNNANMSAYSIMESVGVNKPNGLGNLIYYYQTIKIPNLRIYG